MELQNSHWLLIQHLIPQLEPLKAATDYLEGDQYITVAAIVPVIKGLVARFSDKSPSTAGLNLTPVKVFSRKIKKSISERFKYALSRRWCFISP